MMKFLGLIGSLLFILVASCGSPQKPVKVIDPPRTIDIGGNKIVNSVAFTPDGSLILAGGQNKKMTLIQVDSGKVVWESPEQPEAVLSVAVSPDGKFFASTTSDNTQQTAQIAAFRMDDKSQAWAKTKMTNDAQTLRFSADGKSLYAANFFSIFVFETETGKQLQFFSGHPADVAAPYGHVDAVTGIALSPDPNQFATVGWDRNLKIWDIKEGHEIKTYPQSDPINACFMIEDGRKVVTGGAGTLYVWNRDTDRPDTIVTYDGEIQCMVKIPSQAVFVTGDDKGKLTVWNLDNLSVIRTIPNIHERGVWSVAASKDGQKIATSGGGGKVTIWSLEYLMQPAGGADSTKAGT